MMIFNANLKGKYKNYSYYIFSNVNENISISHPEKFIIKNINYDSLILNLIYDYDKFNKILIGDGIFTKNKNLILSIESKDDLPVYFFAEDFFGLVHISWKNLCLNIIDKIFEIFKIENLNLEKLYIIIGPHMKNLEFNEKQKKYFEEKFQILYKNENFLENFFIEKIINNYFIKKEQILSIPIDTYLNTSYASALRDGNCSNLTNFFFVECN